VEKLHFGEMVIWKIQILEYLEVSNGKNDLRNGFFSEFYIDSCLLVYFFKVILR